eukprot:GILI01001917.1.p1 GENE.GILI01001917.1~~GILI01001917.1.p1  ORF type:complete len:187 (+),score=32.55 GILI01001917.1:55-615(+)
MGIKEWLKENKFNCALGSSLLISVIFVFAAFIADNWTMGGCSVPGSSGCKLRYGVSNLRYVYDEGFVVAPFMYISDACKTLLISPCPSTSTLTDSGSKTLAAGLVAFGCWSISVFLFLLTAKMKSKMRGYIAVFFLLVAGILFIAAGTAYQQSAEVGPSAALSILGGSIMILSSLLSCCFVCKTNL